MSDYAHCPICLSSEGEASYRRDGVDAVIVECPKCGRFELSGTLAATDVERRFGPRWLLSAAIRNRFELQEAISLSTTTVETLLQTARPPSDPFGSINLLIRHIHRKADRPGQGVPLQQNCDYPLVYARDPNEMAFYIEKARGLGFIEPSADPPGYRLGLAGWERLLELRKNDSQSDQAFVAMWFDDALTSAYTSGFAPALSECEYIPTRIDLHEHNEKIDDRIIAEIRRSGLLVADFTGHRGGVYFEAGFAMGLGIPVVWTCRGDHISNAHFDTRQYNHIVWTSPEDLKSRLVNRIRATLPRISSPAV